VGVPRWREVADELGWVDTFDAKYDALARMHADALITLDNRLAYAVKGLVRSRPSRRRPDSWRGQ
jgi:predicted nucleic acid-binding protein